jgi:pimeloyl-ACP methyl ester carboxylesterase
VYLLGKQIGGEELKAFADCFSNRDALDRSLSYEIYLAQYRERAGKINARCHAAFTEAGLDPAKFSTTNSAKDLVGLLAALGYGGLNLHGVSYGTRLALEIIRRHPEANIRSVVLDSPVAPSLDRLATAARAVLDSILRLFEDCANDADCSTAYPNLVERTAALIEQLASQPVTIDDKSIGANELIEQLTDLSNTRANYIPRMIAELETGDPTTYLALLNREVGTPPPEGSSLSLGVD